MDAVIGPRKEPDDKSEKCGNSLANFLAKSPHDINDKGSDETTYNHLPKRCNKNNNQGKSNKNPQTLIGITRSPLSSSVCHNHPLQFIAEAKEVYTELINSHISDPEQRLKVFDKNSVYLPTKKIGKNNPKAAEIEADNTARQEWNRTADLALVSGIEEAKILEIKQTEIHDKSGQSIRENGWLPNLFRGIVGKAKEFLQAIIREKDMPPKPVLNMDMDEFRTMQTLMLKVQKQAKAIKKIQEVTLPNLRQQLAETTGIFKGKERKALEKQIQQTEVELDEKLDKIPDILKGDGYPDVQEFMKTYRKAEAIVTQYNQDLAEWEQTVKHGQKPAEKQTRPPERQSVRNRLRQLQEEGKQNSQPKQRKKSQDRDR